jgi:hypothetical protein
MRRLQGLPRKIGVLALSFALMLIGRSGGPAASGPPSPPEPPGQIRAIVILKEQADVRQATAHLLGQGRQKAARVEAVTRALKTVADRTQGPIRRLLTAAEKSAGKPVIFIRSGSSTGLLSRRRHRFSGRFPSGRR